MGTHAHPHTSTCTGEWRHKSIGTKAPHRRWLGSVSYADGTMRYPQHAAAPHPRTAAELTTAARAAADAATQNMVQAKHVGDQERILDPAIAAQHLRWFALPSDALREVKEAGPAGAGDHAPKHSAPKHGPGTVTLLPDFPSARSANANHDKDALPRSSAPVNDGAQQMVPEAASGGGTESDRTEENAKACATGTCSLGALLRGSCMDDSVDGDSAG